MIGKGLVKWVKEAVVIVGVLAALALTVNAFRADGLSLLSNRKEAGVSQASSGVQAVSIEEAAEKYRRGNVLFLDARSFQAYADGHIKGALSLPDHEFDERFEKAVDRLEQAETLIAYCDGETCPLGRSLAEKLRQLGFQNVYYIVNGWTRWREKGLPVSTGNIER